MTHQLSCLYSSPSFSTLATPSGASSAIAFLVSDRGRDHPHRSPLTGKYVVRIGLVHVCMYVFKRANFLLQLLSYKNIIGLLYYNSCQNRPIGRRLINDRFNKYYHRVLDPFSQTGVWYFKAIK